MDEILYIDKPKNLTSFDVIRELRKKLGIRKMGHAGTLDPRATGLLIIGVGQGTKKLTEYIGHDKTYRAEMLLGISTDTGDLDGAVLVKQDMSTMTITNEMVRNVLKQLRGEHELPVSVYSAIKQGGEALYKKAYRGEVVTPPKRRMVMHELILESVFQEKGMVRIVFEARVGSGTYVRSIAEEIGKRLNAPATLAELRRTSIGEVTIQQARKLSDF